MGDTYIYGMHKFSSDLFLNYQNFCFQSINAGTETMKEFFSPNSKASSNINRSKSMNSLQMLNKIKIYRLIVAILKTT